MSNYEEYQRNKKISINKGYFYFFLLLIMILVLVVSIGLAFDLTSNMLEQVQHRRSTLFLNDNVITNFEIAQQLRTVQLIKFGSIAFASIAFCLMIWLGRSKIEYGFVFNIVWIMVYILALSAPFYLEIKPLTTDILSMVVSSIIIFLLLIWGVSLNVYRSQLKLSIKQKRSTNL